MSTYPHQHFDLEKTEILQRYDILGKAEKFDTSQTARTISLVMKMPIVIVAVNERYRGWLRCTHGIEKSDFDAYQNYCAHAHISSSPFVVEDVRNDGYISDSDTDAGRSDVVFFAGAPLRDPHDKRLGTLCLLDTVKRDFKDEDLKILESFAELVSQDICLRSAGRYAVRDLIAAEEDRYALYDLAMSDPLTKALNRRAFFRLSEREVGRANRYNTHLATMMIDIDHFKQVNDTHGHAVGDEVLEQLVKVLTDGTRDEDIVGRLGGEEFAILLPETDIERAENVANRLREAAKALSFESEKGSFSITISIGLSEPAIGEKSILEALERSDKALYAAKRNGRNRVEVNCLPPPIKAAS